MNKKLYLWFISFIAIMGGLMFGFDIAIISGAVPFIQSYFHWDELQLGWGVSSLLIGAIIGSLGSGMLTDKYGRKGVLVVVALFFALSCLGSALSRSSTLFVLSRIMGGLSVGAASVLSPMYVAEIVPSRVRGSVVSVYQLAITFGILVSYFINYFLHSLANNWRWMFASGTIPSVLFFIGLFLIPESPRWLFLNGRKDEAFGVLCKIGSEEEAEKEMAQIEEHENTSGNATGLKDMLNPAVRRALITGFFLAVLVQVTGINTVIDYAPKILLATGVQIKNALLQTSIIGIVNFVFTFIAILFIDKIGRKPLYMIGSAIMGITLLSLSATFYFHLNSIYSLISLLLFIAAFASCIGPVFWTMVSEIFPNRIRGRALAFASFTQWFFNFLIILFFPAVLQAIGGAKTFILLAIMCIFQFLLSKYMVPETKGKTLEEIESIWERV